MRLLSWQRIAPLTVHPGDTVSLQYDGKTIACAPVDRADTYDIAILFQDIEVEGLDLAANIGGMLARER